MLSASVDKETSLRRKTPRREVGGEWLAAARLKVFALLDEGAF